MTATIYVRLLNEGTEVCRPVEGRLVTEGVYELLPTADYDPSNETWEFPPGSKVGVRREERDGGAYWIAIER